MGLLDHLWDDTVAGPRPDKKLRKYSTFSFQPNKESNVIVEKSKGDGESAANVTRSIKIMKPKNLNIGVDSPPASPAANGSTPPISPFFGVRESNPFRRRSMSDVYERARQSNERND